MRPLETLHNNLCFKSLNNFLTRMIYDRHSPNEIPGNLLKSYLSNSAEICSKINSFDKLEINLNEKTNEEAKKDLKNLTEPK